MRRRGRPPPAASRSTPGGTRRPVDRRAQGAEADVARRGRPQRDAERSTRIVVTTPSTPGGGRPLKPPNVGAATDPSRVLASRREFGRDSARRKTRALCSPPSYGLFVCRGARPARRTSVCGIELSNGAAGRRRSWRARLSDSVFTCYGAVAANGNILACRRSGAVAAAGAT